MQGFKKFLVAGIAAGAMVAGSATYASAADFAPPPAPVSTWTGFWVGAGIGYGFVNHELGAELAIPEFEDNQFAYGRADLGFSGVGGEGWLGQVGLGFDFQVGDKFLIGIFGDYTFSDINSSASAEYAGCINNVGCGAGKVYYKLKADSMWFVGGRAGYLANPDTLLYALIGYTEVDFDAKFGFDNYDCEGDCSNSYKYGWSKGGLTFGGGIETKLSENITGKLEYRYIDLDNKTIFNVGEIDEGGPGAKAWVGSDLQTVTASVAWRFWTGPMY